MRKAASPPLSAPEDSPEEHFADTMAAGDGLCDEEAVRVLVEDGVGYVQRAARLGRAVRSRRDRGSRRLGAKARIACGVCCMRAMRPAVRSGGPVVASLEPSAACAVLNHARAVAPHRRRTVAIVRRCRSSRMVHIETRTVAPGGAAGDGRRRAGVQRDDESVDCHRRRHRARRGGPAHASPISSSCSFIRPRWRCQARRGFCCPRRCAARARGSQSATASDSCRATSAAGELASRDIVSRAIVREIERTRAARCFCRCSISIPTWVHARFPTIAAACRSAGLDLARDSIPVGPAAHYIMGGVETDVWGRTTIPGLYAAGEVACTGVHGANRLASNSLLEGLVFGARAAVAMLQPPRAGAMSDVRVVDPTLADDVTGVAAARSARDRRGTDSNVDVGPVGLLREAATRWLGGRGSSGAWRHALDAVRASARRRRVRRAWPASPRSGG